MKSTNKFQVLAGLPTCGPMPLSFPEKLGLRGQEGVVVEFGEGDSSWVGNFGGGIGGLSKAVAHPDGKRVLVVSEGEAWVVDPIVKSASELGITVNQLWEYEGDLLLDHQGLAVCRLAAEGVLWHTRRLSWDGLRNVEIQGTDMHVEVNTLEAWEAQIIDLKTGRAMGEMLAGIAGADWEQLADG